MKRNQRKNSASRRHAEIVTTKGRENTMKTQKTWTRADIERAEKIVEAFDARHPLATRGVSGITPEDRAEVLAQFPGRTQASVSSRLGLQLWAKRTREGRARSGEVIHVAPVAPAPVDRNGTSTPPAEVEALRAKLTDAAVAALAARASSDGVLSALVELLTDSTVSEDRELLDDLMGTIIRRHPATLTALLRVLK